MGDLTNVVAEKSSRRQPPCKKKEPTSWAQQHQLKQRSQQLGSATRYTSTTSKPGQPCVGDNEVVTKASRRQPKRSLAVGLSNTRKGANQLGSATARWQEPQPAQGEKAHRSNNPDNAGRHGERTSVLLQPNPWAAQDNWPGRSANNLHDRSRKILQSGTVGAWQKVEDSSII